MALTSLKSCQGLIRAAADRWRALRKCSRCLLPEGFRDIRFDEAGVCNHCTDLLDLGASVAAGRREPELRALLEARAGRPDADHDAVVAYSGGGDSSYLLKLMVERYGLRVLAVTVDTGFMSETALENVEAGVETLGVDHLWVEADPRLVDVYRFGLAAETGLGLEVDVCDLCDGHLRRSVLEVACERSIPLVVHGADHFQAIDFGLHRGSSLLLEADAPWPHLARRRGLFRELYTIRTFDPRKPPPVEVYPFLYLPYDQAAVQAEVEEAGVAWDTTPDRTNCELTFLLNVLDLLRHGYPAYVHATSQAILGGEIDRERAMEELAAWFEEYAEGVYDAEVFRALPALGLELDELLAPGGPAHETARSTRGVTP